MKLLVLALFGVLCLAVFGAVADPTPTPAVQEPIHFMHNNHKDPLAKIGIDVDDPAQCKTCHTLDAAGKPRAPAAQGHAPCLRGGCHVTDFLVVSESGKKTRPQEFTRASQLCLGCHTTVPWAWKKPQTLTLQAWRNQREHHIEMEKKGDPPRGMDHYDHITIAKTKDGKSTTCRSCHSVDAEFKLAVGTPGHGQCLQCHSTEGPAFAMAECGRCHQRGGREGWLTGVLAQRNIKVDPDKGIEGSRPNTTVRACGSAGDAKWTSKTKRKTPCFKHETPGHRMTNDKADVQCKQCHFVISDPKVGATQFRSVADLHTRKIIGDTGQQTSSSKFGCPGSDKDDVQHAACSGGSACHRHAKEVDADCALGERNCVLCHAQRTNNEAF